jgi:GDP-L-fucose synthase
MTDRVYSLAGKSIWVAGHTGMVGSAVVRRLASEDCRIITATHAELDLRRQADVDAFLGDHRPDIVVLAAAKVGGILANDTRPAEFLYDNLMIESNIIAAAHSNDVERLLFLGSSCIYPKFAEQPIREDSLLTGPLEPTNEWYAIAKIAGVKLIQSFRKQYGRDYISAMPTNLYGTGDNYDLASSHVVPALLRKAHEAKLRGDSELVLWGSGRPLREFLHADDCADAIVYLLQHYSDAPPINIGSGEEVSIDALAQLISTIVGFTGQLRHDDSKPDGTPRKLLDSSRIHRLGWQPKIGLEDGLRSAYSAFLETVAVD